MTRLGLFYKFHYQSSQNICWLFGQIENLSKQTAVAIFWATFVKKLCYILASFETKLCYFYSNHLVTLYSTYLWMVQVKKTVSGGGDWGKKWLLGRRLGTVWPVKVSQVYKSCPKMISLEKWTILIPLQKLPNNLCILGKIIVATGFEKLPKVQ